MSIKSTKEQFVEKANKVHNGKYDYSKFVYVNNRTNGLIICYTHGEFLQTSNIHLNGHGCRKCGYERHRLTVEMCILRCEKFIKKAQKVKEHIGKNYDYSNFVYVTNDIKGIIICPKHGEFLQNPNDHIHNGAGCPVCKSSKGEQTIKLYLEVLNINYIRQYKFPDCRNIHPLPFDFFLPEFNTVIEFQGKQHFVGWNDSKKSLIDIQHRDKIKRDYCQKNNIKLVEITYKDDVESNLDLIFNPCS